MKNTLKLLVIIALAAMMGFTMIACNNDGDDSTPTEIASIYCFENGRWFQSNGNSDSLVTVTATTIIATIDGGEIDANFTGVYSDGGKSLTFQGTTVTYAYLYDGSGKIGIAMAYSGGGKDVFIGSDTCAEFLNEMSNLGINHGMSSAGIQNTKNGHGAYPDII